MSKTAEDQPTYHKNDTLVISDLHLGSMASNPLLFSKFLDMLIANPPRRLILAGDIFEMWNANYQNLGAIEYRTIAKVFALAEKGTHLVYIPGNHDRAFRGFRKITVGETKIRNEYILRHNHKKYLILHGDEFDSFTSNHVVLALILDQLYVALIKFSAFCKRFIGWKVSLAERKSSKRYEKMVAKIRAAAIYYARSREMNGLIMGHTHWPEVVQEKDGLVYANCGDWLETCSYVVVGEEVTLHSFMPPA
jgi:UDP-2,3-diacylglucosamine pyrophosphatase LpxH